MSDNKEGNPITRRGLLKGALGLAGALALETALPTAARAQTVAAEVSPDLAAGMTAAEAGNAPENTASNSLSFLLSEVPVPNDPVDKFFLTNIPGSTLSEDPQNIPGFLEFDNRPGKYQFAYFNIPNGPKPPVWSGYGDHLGVNSIAFDRETNEVKYMEYDVSFFPSSEGKKNSFLMLDDVISKYGEPDESPKVSIQNSNYKLVNYASKGKVLFVGNFGHDGAEKVVYKVQSFIPVSSEEYYNYWGYKENTGNASGAVGK